MPLFSSSSYPKDDLSPSGGQYYSSPDRTSNFSLSLSFKMSQHISYNSLYLGGKLPPESELNVLGSGHSRTLNNSKVALLTPFNERTIQMYGSNTLTLFLIHHSLLYKSRIVIKDRPEDFKIPWCNIHHLTVFNDEDPYCGCLELEAVNHDPSYLH